MGKILEANKNRPCYAYFINLATFDWLKAPLKYDS